MLKQLVPALLLPLSSQAQRSRFGAVLLQSLSSMVVLMLPPGSSADCSWLISGFVKQSIVGRGLNRCHVMLILRTVTNMLDAPHQVWGLSLRPVRFWHLSAHRV